MSAGGRAEESPQQGIQSIEVGLQVLRALEAGRGPMALSEVARNCAMHPAKVHRYGPDRGLVLAIGLAMPARLMVEGHGGGADRLADALRSTAGQISAELGYRPA
jgi:DNA-binding IclR family transcriptional regulator